MSDFQIIRMPEEKEALARAADAFMEKQKEDNVLF